ncbi:NAD(P)H-hydrate dehydratase [Hwanghaeella grinnelliae]|uniref:Bifunctional NAD(P)H-hydrate repair enzyme n=1 Tax=Hwanghaeella grinnelliae TaxID=2500179 RepID=A0A3S2VS72_9PROT|nr:NAD(P)H-hydrate dehydratase [Hwanghaeella grinnelliae]RVU39282.1 NAD(P)H-hydrate dehydratase [Hwanghaeella grinnelliae]
MAAGFGHAGNALLTVQEMYAADAAAIEQGIAGTTLMENAGRTVAEAIMERWSPRPTVVLCGPGNNGGDGFVVARLLKERGWPVRLVSLVPIGQFKGDARHHADLWTGEVEMPEAGIGDAALIVDALFGAGLTRDVDGAARSLLEDSEGRDIVAIDVPSGVHGDTGQVLGYAAQAALTVTFFRRKPGHLLLPGRVRCAEVVVTDIGIPKSVLEGIDPQQIENGPELWAESLHWPNPTDHKYARGHSLVVGGAIMTGAARMSAKAAQRAGAGAVTVAAPADAQTVYKVTLESIMVASYRDTSSLQDIIEMPKVSAVLIGPGTGMVTATRERACMVLRTGKPAVVDADAISIFEGSSELLFESVNGPVVMTPHEGEFARVFPDLQGGRLFRARAAAARSGCIVLLKGYDTVIAAPDGRVAINANAPADLATAGAGDVLSGIIVALLSQGLPPFEAACAGAWIHAESAMAFGPGLIPEDVIAGIPAVLSTLKSRR